MYVVHPIFNTVQGGQRGISMSICFKLLKDEIAVHETQFMC